MHLYISIYVPLPELLHYLEAAVDFPAVEYKMHHQFFQPL